MMYENSIEEQKYLSVIRKEKDSFEKLIREKSVNVYTFVLQFLPVERIKYLLILSWILSLDYGYSFGKTFKSI